MTLSLNRRSPRTGRRAPSRGRPTVVVHLHYLELDEDLAVAHPDLWWSAEWGPAGMLPLIDDSSPALADLVGTVVRSARREFGPVVRIAWCLHQGPADPPIELALIACGQALPDHLG